jgi:hypothetical protein
VELEEFDFLYPLCSYDRYGNQYRWHILQLISWAGGSTQTEQERHRFTIFPIYFHQRSSDPAENYTALIPFYGNIKDRLFRREIHFVMWPGYVQTRKRDMVTDNYLAPIVHVRHGPGLKGWQVWPFVGFEHKDVTTRTNNFNEPETVPAHDTKFVLWPIFSDDKSGLGTDNPVWTQSLLPFYSVVHSPERESTTVLWPFFAHIDDREQKYREWDAPWPFIEFASGEGKNTTRIFPFYSHAAKTNLETVFYMWPVYKCERIHAEPLERSRTRILFYLYNDIREQNTETGRKQRRVDLWPLFTHKRDFHGNSRLQVLAPLEVFVMGSHKIDRDFSPIWSVWRSEHNAATGARSQSLLWNLYRHDATAARKTTSALFGLFQYQSGADGSRLRLFYVPFRSPPPAPLKEDVFSPQPPPNR